MSNEIKNKVLQEPTNPAYFNVLTYAAIHIISESSDHYNLLLLIENLDDIEAVKKQLEMAVLESPYYWSDYFVTTNDKKKDTKLKTIISSLMDDNDTPILYS